MSSSNFGVREAKPSDLDGVVSVHRRAFPGFLMTLLGPGFLYAYYSTLLDFPKSIFFILEREGETVGFAAGMHDPSEFYARFKRKRAHALVVSLPYVVSRPWIWRRLFESASQLNIRGADRTGSGDVELASIAVDSDKVKPGAGRSLLAAFVAQAGLVGASRVVLTTDASGNDRVNAFYQKAGFIIARTISRGAKRHMNEYVFVLPNRGP